MSLAECGSGPSVRTTTGGPDWSGRSLLTKLIPPKGQSGGICLNATGCVSGWWQLVHILREVTGVGQPSGIDRLSKLGGGTLAAGSLAKLIQLQHINIIRNFYVPYISLHRHLNNCTY